MSGNDLNKSSYLGEYLPDNQSAEDGLSEEMGQDTGFKGGEARQDAEDIIGPMSLKDWLWINRQKEG